MKKRISVLLLLVMLLSLMPTATAATVVKIAYSNVFNFNQSSNISAYDPVVSTDGSYFTISAPYDSIAKSAPAGGFAYGPNYRVVFSLSESIDRDKDTLWVNNTVINNNGILDRFSGEYTDGSIVCVFIPQRGGNSMTYTATVFDKSENTSSSKTITVRYIDGTSGSNNNNNNIWNVATTSMTLMASKSATNYKVTSDYSNIYIDYDSRYLAPGSYLDVNFTFNDAYNTRIPSGGTAYLYNVSSNGKVPFIDSYQYDMSYNQRGSFSYSLNIPVTLDTSNTSISMAVKGNSYAYQTNTYSVIWRDTSKTTSGTGSVNVLPTRYPVLAIGQNYTFTITPNSWNTSGNYYSIDVGGASGIVGTGGYGYLTIRGLATGSTWLNVRDGWNNIVETIYVTVGTTTTAVPPIAIVGGDYRVNARSVNVRAGAGVGYAKVGSLYSGQSVQVLSTIGGWSSILYNNSTAYVSSSLLTYVGGSVIGVYPPTSGTVDSGSLAGGLLGGGSTSDTSTTGGQLGGGNSYTVPGSGLYMTVQMVWTDVYAGPGTNYTNIGSATQGQRVYVNSVTNSGWAYINWGTGVGYINYGAIR